MRLNLACGDLRMEGYTNVDLRPECADVVADVTDLSFVEDGAAEAIVALDCLEHFPQARTQDILAEWHRVLAPGGTLTLKVPNLHAIAVQLAYGVQSQNAMLVEQLIRNVYGAHRWGPDGAWDAHHTGWTPLLLDAELTKAGFELLSNDEALNMRVEARRVKG